MISKIERKIALRYLKPKKKEGFLKVISIFSFMGISLGVAILIIVMSVMNGFRTELITKILGFNPHIIVKPYSKEISDIDLKKINTFNDYISRTAFTFNGHSILINRDNTTGVLVRSYIDDDISKISLIKDGYITSAISLDFKAWGSSAFLPPVSLPIFQLSLETLQAERPQRTKPMGE